MNEEQLRMLAQYLPLLSRGNTDMFAAPEQKKRQAGILAASGLFDAIGGGLGQRSAEGDIERAGATLDEIRDKYQGVKRKNTADLMPEAVRNAAIFGSRKAAPDVAEESAAREAIRAGADPTRVQRALGEAKAAERTREEAERRGLVREGLGAARMDEDARINKIMFDLGLDREEAMQMLQGSQARSVESQRRKQSGLRNLTNAAIRFAGAGAGGDKNKQAVPTIEDTSVPVDFNKGLDKFYVPEPSLSGPGGAKFEDMDDFLGFLRDFDKEQGGVVKETPESKGVMGPFPEEFNTDGIKVYPKENRIIKLPGDFSHSTNPIDIIRDGKKVGEMTGGEFVINPDQANGMKKAYEKVKKNPTQANITELFEAVRFLDEPQFD
tara:strand:+ start:16497 stop:17639 length:1143 start_codon:yes stop_codon:yes gene_type:complete